MDKVTAWFKHRPWLALVLAVCGGLVYFGRSIYFAQHADLTMDEGTYLMKGWLFATGQYKPFQPYGPWTQKMPLAYLIPGAAQLLFGPGLRTGRYLAVFLGVLMLLGAWLLTRRLAGKWASVLVVWFFAFSTANIYNYSQAITQVLVACLSLWAMFFLLGKRSAWQVGVGGILLSALVLTRQNLVTLLGLGILYAFWEHGRRKGMLVLGTAALTLIICHALYWPEILSAWAFLPQSLTPFLDPWRLSPDALPTWQVSYPPFGFLDAFLEGLLFNLTAITAVLMVIIFWPFQKKAAHLPNAKAVIFLLASFFVLLFTHAYAAFGNEYGSFSLTTYYSFSRYLATFGFYGWLCLLLAFPFLAQTAPARIRSSISGLLVLLLATCIGLGAYKSFSFVMTLQVPRMREMRFLPGTTDLWRLLANKFGLTFEIQQRFLPALFTLGLSILLLVILWVVQTQFKRNRVVSYGMLSLLFFFSVSTLLSPFPILSKNIQLSTCSFDVLKANEEVGAYLAQTVPPGSLLYWHSGISPTPLLYLDHIRIFPAQLDQDFNIFIHNDPEELARAGLWSADLATQWLEQADVVLLTDRYVPDYLRTYPLLQEMDETEPIDAQFSCRENSVVHIFIKE